ncbi:hypothetical protein ACHAW5_008352 [Stephanodiscus triporus]|uniref:Strictosidine synthase conserved region domain-containing protein n=1 Tax=Stephanodiscus triporus TaxID=2934178 RepID=A0ABD3NQD2_9STRA
MVEEERRRPRLSPWTFLAFSILATSIHKRLLSYLLPYGPAVDIPIRHRPKCVAPVVDDRRDSNNVVSLRMSSRGGITSTKIYERFEEGDGRRGPPLLLNPETIVFDDDGAMYVMNENAKLIMLVDFVEESREEGEGDGGGEKTNDDARPVMVLTAKAIEVADLGIGRPLGGKFGRNGCLYFADAVLGLARVCDLPGVANTTTTSMSSSSSSSSSTSPRPIVELVASRVKLEDGSWSSINYADDVDVGPRTGHVYFTDATDVRTDRDVRTGRWDILYASKVEGVRGKRTGRLLRYRPETGEVDVLASGAAFANGVSVMDEEETRVLYTSTFEAVVMMHRLDGNGKGGGGGGGGGGEGAERLLDGFPGLLDGIDCPRSRPGLCYVAIVSTLSPPVNAIFSMTPSWLGRVVRSLLMMIPRSWSPPLEPYGGVAEIFVGDDENGGPARITRIFQDIDGRDFSTITGVTEHDGKLYLGSLHADYVGVVSLD